MRFVPYIIGLFFPITKNNWIRHWPIVLNNLFTSTFKFMVFKESS